MDSIVFNLDKLMEYTNFQKLQDNLSNFLGLSIITVDYKGTPVTTHSNCTKFCNELRSDSGSNLLCEKCDSLGGIEAARNRKPYIYMCHKGLVDLAIPILYKDIYLGSVMLGQIILENNDDILKLDRIRFNKDTSDIECTTYNELPKMSLSKIKAIADTSFFFINQIILDAINSLTNTASTKNTALGSNKSYYKQHKGAVLLQPALSYIKNNFEKPITLNELAEMCDITPSYFSKLFKKVTKTNLVHYINDIRIEKAKMLLLSSNDKLGVISANVGFADCGYFIKVFKKQENITPNMFRDKNQN